MYSPRQTLEGCEANIVVESLRHPISERGDEENNVVIIQSARWGMNDTLGTHRAWARTTSTWSYGLT